MPEALLYVGALCAAITGMGWLALAMESYWCQVHGGAPRRRATAGRLRACGALGLTVSFALAAFVDGPAMASLVWIMFLTLSIVTIAFALTWRPQYLRPLWLSRPTIRARHATRE